jgi:hypothetical protein
MLPHDFILRFVLASICSEMRAISFLFWNLGGDLELLRSDLLSRSANPPYLNTGLSLDHNGVPGSVAFRQDGGFLGPAATCPPDHPKLR